MSLLGRTVFGIWTQVLGISRFLLNLRSPMVWCLLVMKKTEQGVSFTLLRYFPKTWV